MKKTLLILFTTLTANLWACSCMGIDDYYKFFKYNKTTFVGKVIGETNKGSYMAYEFQVINKFHTKFEGTVIITNKNNAAGCTVGFKLGETYVLSPRKFEGGYNITRCAYIKSSRDDKFSEDTMLIRLLTLKNVSIRSNYFKGQIKNGKRHGLWTNYYDDSTMVGETGNYIRDKMDGKWTDYTTETYYRNGKFIKMIELVGDSLFYKVKTLRRSRIMYYPDGKIRKKLTNKTYTVFSKSGQVIEMARLKKNGYILEWFLYNENGTIRKSVKLEQDDNSRDPYDEFFDTSELSSLEMM